MARSKVAVSLDTYTLQRLDRLVAEAVFPNRSQAIQVAVEEKLARLEQHRLAWRGVETTHPCVPTRRRTDLA